MVLALLISIVIARYYGPEGFASFQAYLSLAVVWASVGYLCSAEVLIPRFARDPVRYALVFEHAFLLRALAALMAAMGYVYYIAFHYGNDPALGLPLVALVLLTEPFAAFGVYFQAVGKQGVWSRIRLGWLGVKVGAIVLIATAGWPLAWITLPYAVEALGAGLMVAWRYRQGLERPAWQLDRRLLRELLRHGLVMGIGLIAMVWLQKLDRLYLASEAAFDRLGYYAAGMQIAESWFFCAFFLVQAIAGRFVFAQPPLAQVRRIQQLLLRFAGVALLGWAAGAVLAPVLVPWVYGAEFAPAASWLQWQLGLAVLVWCEAALGVAMLARHATWWVAFKWACALLAAWLSVHSTLLNEWLPTPLAIPVTGYSVALLISAAYFAWFRRRVRRDALPASAASAS